MPIYVYRNLTTGQTFEVEQRMVDPALTTDPVTGDPVKRLIQPVGIAFKGSGFYVNDSRGKNGASVPSASASASASSDTATSTASSPTPTPAAPPAPAAPAASSSASSGAAAD